MHVQSTIQIVELQTNPVCKRPFSPPCTIHPVLTSNPYDLLLNSLPGSWSLSFRIINVSGDAPCMLYLPAFGSYLIMFGQMLVEMSHARSLAQKNFYTITYHLWSFTNKHWRTYYEFVQTQIRWSIIVILPHYINCHLGEMLHLTHDDPHMSYHTLIRFSPS